MNSSPVAGVSECTHRHAGTGGVMVIPNNPNQQNAFPWQEKNPFPTQSKLEDQKLDITKLHSNSLVMLGCLSHPGLCLTLVLLTRPDAQPHLWGDVLSQSHLPLCPGRSMAPRQGCPQCPPLPCSWLGWWDWPCLPGDPLQLPALRSRGH